MTISVTPKHIKKLFTIDYYKSFISCGMQSYDYGVTERFEVVKQKLEELGYEVVEVHHSAEVMWKDNIQVFVSHSPAIGLLFTVFPQEYVRISK